MKCKKHNQELIPMAELSLYFCSQCVKALSEEGWENENIEQSAWYLKLADDKNWHLRAFEEYPFMISHEYKRIKLELENGCVFGAMLQIKDLFEALLKFNVLLMTAMIYRKSKKSSNEKEIIRQLIGKILSFGDWLRIARLIEKLSKNNLKMKEDNVIKAISFLIKIYDGGSKGIVEWRNATIAHGALKFKDDEDFIKDITQKIELIRKTFCELDYYLSNLKIYYKDEFGKITELKGSLLNQNINNLSYDLFITVNEKEINLNPFIRFDRKGIYFFDTYISSKTKTDLLNYPEGDKISKSKIEMNEMYNLFNKEVKKEKSNDEIRSKTYDALKDKMIESIKEVDDFVEPEYLIKTIKEYMDNNTKGIMLLQMEAGMGKSVLCRSLDEQSRIYRNYFDGFGTRAVYLNSTYNNNAYKMYDTIISKLKENRIGERVITGIDVIESNPKKRLSKSLNLFLNEHRNYWNKDKLLVIFDGLDEVPYLKENSIFDCIPELEDLEDNVYILLTCRTNAEISDHTKSQLNKLRDVHRFKPITKNSPDNELILSQYIKSNITENEKDIKLILSKANFKFIYVSMTKIFFENSLSNVDDLPEHKDMFLQYIKNIKSKYGEKQGKYILDILALMTTIYEPITLDELVFLLGESNPSYKLLACIEDLKYLLKSERVTGRGTVYSLAHSDFKEYIENNHNIFLDRIRSRVKYYISTFEDIMISQKLVDLSELYEYYNNNRNDGEMYLLSYIKDYVDKLTMDENEKKNLYVSIDSIKIPPVGTYNYSSYMLQRIIRIISQKMEITQTFYDEENLSDEGYLILINYMPLLYWQRGMKYQTSMDIEKALRDFNKAIELLEELDINGELTNKDFLATSYINRGGVYLDLKMFKESLRDDNKAIKILEDLKRDSLEKFDDNDLGVVYINRGNVYKDLNKPKEALNDFEEAIKILEKLYEDRNIFFVNDLAKAYTNHGGICGILGRFDDSIEDCNKSIDILDKLDKSGKLYVRDDLAHAYQTRGTTYGHLNKRKEQIMDYDKTIEILEALQYEGKLYDRYTLGKLYGLRAMAYSLLEKHKEAIKEYLKSIEILEDLDSKMKLLDRDYLWNICYLYIESLRELNMQETAIEVLGKSLKMNLKDNDLLYYTLAEVYSELNNLDEVYKSIKSAVELGYSVKEIKENELFKNYLSDTTFSELLNKYN